MTEFGAVPNDEGNDAEALRRAVSACRESGARALFIPPGRYILRDEEAVRLESDVLHGKYGENPQDGIYNPGFAYVKGLDFSGITGLTVEAEGAEIICEGWMEPISLIGCRDVTLNGLTIDSARKPFSVGKIVRITPEYYEVEFNEEYPVFAETIMPRVRIWDPERSRLLSKGMGLGRRELVSPQVLRIHGPCDENRIGFEAIFWHCLHFRPAILILDSSNVEINNVTIHSQPGMGIVGHMSTDIRMNGLRVVPRPGLHISTNTDATHFVSCRGTIEFNGCMFEGQGDDSTNVHVYYFGIRKHEEQGVCDLIWAGSETGSHSQYLDRPQAGDTLELAERRTLRTVGSYKVRSVTANPEGYFSTVELDGALPENPNEYRLVNVDALPKVRVRSCCFRNHRARALLIKTRDVLIENCAFEGITGTAIQIGAEADWGEGVPPADVTVRNCRIIDCGEDGDGRIEGANAIMVGVLAEDNSTVGLIRNITLEGNLIEGKGRRAIFIGNAENVILSHNQLHGYEEDVFIINSTGIDAENNKGLKIVKETR